MLRRVKYINKKSAKRRGREEVGGEGGGEDYHLTTGEGTNPGHNNTQIKKIFLESQKNKNKIVRGA
jgi:hypothetical protein